ncbi:MAG: hypothetical protein SFV15_17450 [Polyangiaceae bacterium]|nr:hypothetical protein [Polyangiaceae bacterium]
MRGTSSLIGVGIITFMSLVGCGSEEKPKFSPNTALGGAAGTGGGKTGGAKATGGAAGAGVGGAPGMPMGGMAGGGGVAGTPGVMCPSASFLTPVSGATLTAAADATTDCSNGFQTTVSVATSAAEGTAATLFASNVQVGTATVSGNAAVFTGVQLDSNATVNLKVQVGAAPECSAEIPVTVACSPVVCTIAKPVISAMHPSLNGEAAPAGDRVSQNGSPYQVTFEVTTNVEDGRQVLLSINDGAQSLAAPASGGVATFAGVTLVPDGDFTAEATCTSQAGQTTKSSKPTFHVDTAGPVLAPSGIAGGQYFGPSDDVDLNAPEVQFKVCGSTTSPDAVDLAATLGAGQNNFCVAVGTGSPACVAATTNGVANGTNGGCVNVTCPGGAGFDLNLTLSDEAGNLVSQTLQNVKCASTLPSVQIITPTPSVTNDPSTNILAATAAQSLKDADGGTLGAQFTVVACTDTAGGSAQLLSGLAGGTLAVIGSATATPAQVSDGCPNNLGNVIRFTNARLTESSVLANGTLDKATELRVAVTAPSTATNTSGATLVWVDSTVPTVTPYIPNNLCTRQENTPSPPALVPVTLKSPPGQPLTLKVTNGGATDYVTTADGAGNASFGSLPFALGSNALSAVFVEPSGNTGSLAQPCTVTVGNTPVVTWISPAPGTTKLNLASDTDVAAGWQGQLQVKVETDPGSGRVPASGVKVTFKLNGNMVVEATTDGSGFATVASATLTDAQGATLLAQTESVPSFGVGSASIAPLSIDTVKPSAIASLTVSVPALERRATKMKVDWLAPADSGAAVASYDLRRSKSPITNMTQFLAATPVAISGLPQSPGASESVLASGLFIETDYYFAITSADAGGNVSDITNAGPTRATFNVTLLDNGDTNAKERRVDGSASIDGDAFADLLVGAQGWPLTPVSVVNDVEIYRGSANGYPSTPNVTITGPNGFGQAVAVLGDIDGDGALDVGVGSPSENKVYIFSRIDWATVTTLTNIDASYVLSVDTVADSKLSGCAFGVSIARLGDFNGDGVADFVVGANRYNSVSENGSIRAKGLAVIFLGKKPYPGTLSIPQAYGTDAIEVRNEDFFGLSGAFGSAVLGIGNLYDPNKADLIVSAPGLNKVYSFQGTANKTALSAAAATHSAGVAGSNGSQTLALVGQLSGNPAVGVGGANNKPDLFFGNAAVGPFGGTVAHFTNSAATLTADAFGSVIVGGGFSGTSTQVSFIGDNNEPDVVFTSKSEGGVAPPKLYILRGSAATAGGDIVGVADVTYTLPVGFGGGSSRSGAINDLNGDGYGDIAIGETRSAATTYRGKVLVLW